MSPIRIQRQRIAGWRMPPNTVYVGRPTIWGNPFAVGEASGCDFKDGGDPTPIIAALTPEQSVEFYRALISGFLSPKMHPHGHEWVRNFRRKARGAHPSEWARAALRGKNLACWCPLTNPDGSRHPCHADVLLELANSDEGRF